MRTQLLDGRTPMQALVESFDADNFVWKVKKENSCQVTHLFFAHRKSFELFATYPEVLVMECTYKSNWFNLPLLNIVGMTATFFVASTFLIHEREKKTTLGHSSNYDQLSAANAAPVSS